MDWTRLANNLKKHGRGDLVKKYCPDSTASTIAIDNAISRARAEFHDHYCWFDGTNWILEGRVDPLVMVDDATAARINSCDMCEDEILALLKSRGL